MSVRSHPAAGVSRVSVSTRSVRRLRLTAGLTRHLVRAAAVAGLLASARYAILPPPTPRAPTVAPATSDPAAEGFAALFARRYLTWDTGHPEEHQAAMAPFMGADSDADAGLRLPVSGSETVSSAQVVQSRLSAGTGHAYTVAVQTDRSGLLYLSVTVQRTGDGQLRLAGYPALVGAPFTGRSSAGADERLTDVPDPTLTAVVGRALTNYLAASTTNLAADLTSDARVAPPGMTLTLTRVLWVKWAPGGGAVIALVQADDPQAVGYTLRYELDVSQIDGRWEIGAVQMDPTS